MNTQIPALSDQDLITAVGGSGSGAQRGQTLIVHWRGTFENGQEFNSSYGRDPISFPLDNRVIKGWEEGLVGMQVGEKRQLVVPPHLAYGEKGAGGAIPPNATLLYDIELLEIR